MFHVSPDNQIHQRLKNSNPFQIKPWKGSVCHSRLWNSTTLYVHKTKLWLHIILGKLINLHLYSYCVCQNISDWIYCLIIKKWNWIFIRKIIIFNTFQIYTVWIYQFGHKVHNIITSRTRYFLKKLVIIYGINFKYLTQCLK